jgi:hypothetical protein
LTWVSEKQLEKELDDASKAIVKAEEQGKPVEEINELKNIQDKTKIAMWITGLSAEDISDGRDEIMKKDPSKIHFCFYFRMMYFFSKYHTVKPL